MKYDFSGWATKNDLKCSDGRIIRKDAFKSCDGATVPLVWNHSYNTPENVLGHALLKNQENGVYAYGVFNNNDTSQKAKELLLHGDITGLSIYANKLKQNGPNVIHGEIKEVSLVLATANPGAYIEDVIRHGETTPVEDEGIIYTGQNIALWHSDDNNDDDKKKGEGDDVANKSTNDDTKKNNKTVGDVIDGMTEEQKTVMYALVGQALSATNGEKGNDDEDEDEEDNKGMKHNVFDNDEMQQGNALSHSQIQTIISDAKRFGSLKESFIQHSQEYGIEDIDYLFPDAKSLNTPPDFIKRDMDWVQKVMRGVHHTPFSRIKSIFADITEDDARAKGYIKGNMKKEEVFGLLKRTTTPTTVYKKQKLDRDDVVDITDFDVVTWLKAEMRMMLDEEIARAVLVGDGRSTSSDDKINEQNVRPIMTDDDLYTIKTVVTADSTGDDDVAKAFIRAAIRARKDYKGSGQPSLYTTEDMLTSCLLLTDGIGRDLYNDEAQLAKKLRVKEIITVPVMENVTGSNGGDLLGIIVNLADYNVGADKGGSVNMFDDFDIDYNQMKYLIETRCSGALIKPYSAIALELSGSSSDDGDTEEAVA